MLKVCGCNWKAYCCHKLLLKSSIVCDLVNTFLRVYSPFHCIYILKSVDPFFILTSGFTSLLSACGQVTGDI